jgi:hypothetical protein
MTGFSAAWATGSTLASAPQEATKWRPASVSMVLPCCAQRSKPAAECRFDDQRLVEPAVDG